MRTVTSGARTGLPLKSVKEPPAMPRNTIDLPSDVMVSVKKALEDYLNFGPGELDADYIPDDHLLAAVRIIDKTLAARSGKAEIEV